MTLKKITADELLHDRHSGVDPDKSREWEMNVRELLGGRENVSPLELARCEDFTVHDRLWFLLDKCVIPQPERGLLCCDFAERALPIHKQTRPGDMYVRDRIKAERLRLRETDRDEADSAEAWDAETITRTRTLDDPVEKAVEAFVEAVNAAVTGNAALTAYAASVASCMWAVARTGTWNAGWKAHYVESRWQLDRTVDVLKKLEAAGG